jgi:hypothetical protein
MGSNKIDSVPSVANRVAENAFEGLSSILTIKPVAKYLSGARCVLRINGKVVGFAFGISWTINTMVEEINTIDNYQAHELAPSRVEVNGNISGFRIPGSGPGSQLIQTDLISFLHQRYIEIEVRDSQTDNLIFLTRKALVTKRSESIKTGSLADMSLEFRAIGFLDERSQPSAPLARGSDTTATGLLNRALNTRF